jgi:hypothetical protein
MIGVPDAILTSANESAVLESQYPLLFAATSHVLPT